VEAPVVVAETPKRRERPSLFGTVLGWGSKKEAARPSLPGKPYVTDGMIYLPDEEQEERGPMSSAADRLRRRVLQACGNSAGDVWVKPRNDGSMLVTVRIADGSRTEMVMSRVAAVPEMQSPKVHLSLEYAH
jgi:hypothetical protein